VNYDLRAFIVAVLHQLRAPVTPANQLALEAWHACEGGAAAYNPLNTTLWQPGCSNYNSFGPHGAYHVRNYPDAATGIRATVLTMENGHYPHIVAGLRAGDSAYNIVRGAASGEMDTWGTGGRHVKVWLDAHHAGNTRPPAPTPTHSHHVYVVRPGDTLAEIAQRYHLRDWHRLYDANRHVIGGNPNHIEPGQRLVIP